MINAHCSNMARKLTNKKNDRLKQQDLDYGKNTEKRGKGDTHMVGHGIWLGTVKNVKKEKCTHTVLP